MSEVLALLIVMTGLFFIFVIGLRVLRQDVFMGTVILWVALALSIAVYLRLCPVNGMEMPAVSTTQNSGCLRVTLGSRSVNVTGIDCQ